MDKLTANAKWTTFTPPQWTDFTPPLTAVIIAPVQARRITGLAATEGRFEAHTSHLSRQVNRALRAYGELARSATIGAVRDPSLVEG